MPSRRAPLRNVAFAAALPAKGDLPCHVRPSASCFSLLPCYPQCPLSRREAEAAEEGLEEAAQPGAERRPALRERLAQERMSARARVKLGQQERQATALVVQREVG